MSESFRKGFVSNVSFNAAARIVAFMLQGVANIILARLLLPSDYGVVSFAIIFVQFTLQFYDFGISASLVQKKDATMDDIYTGFTLRIFISLSAMVLISAAAPLTRMFFDDEAVVLIIRVFSLLFPLYCCGFLSHTLLTRELQFKKISFLETLETAVSALTAITLAFAGMGYWSMVTATVTAAAVQALALNLSRRVPFRMRLNRESVQYMMGFGLPFAGAGFLTFAMFQTDKFIVGTSTGATSLGYYVLAFNWGTVISTAVTGVLHNILFATLSRIQDDKERVKSAFFKVFEYAFLVALLANMTLFVIADDFLYVILGRMTDKWMPALGALRIFCFYGLFRVLAEMLRVLPMVQGKTQVLLRINFWTALVQMVLIYPSLHLLGLEGAAAAVALASVLPMFAFARYLNREMQMTWTELAVPLKALCCAVVVAAVVYFVHAGRTPGLLLMIEKAAFSVAGFVLLHGLLSGWQVYKGAARLVREIRTPARGVAGHGGE